MEAKKGAQIRVPLAAPAQARTSGFSGEDESCRSVILYSSTIRSDQIGQELTDMTIISISQYLQGPPRASNRENSFSFEHSTRLLPLPLPLLHGPGNQGRKSFGSSSSRCLLVVLCNP